MWVVGVLKLENIPTSSAEPRGDDLESKTCKDTAVDLKSSETGAFQLVERLASGGSIGIEMSEELFGFFVKLTKILEEKQTQYGNASERQTIDRMLELDPICPLAIIQKYLERVKNKPEKAERDLLKIATYAYFMWRSFRRERAQETPCR